MINIIKIKLQLVVTNLTQVFNFLRFIAARYIDLCTIFFLRRTNTFIKSKYSKNRQWSKVIVYFGLWFGVISAFAITYYTYRFLFAFSYLWWVGAILVGITLCQHTYKHRKYVTAAFLKIFLNK